MKEVKCESTCTCGCNERKPCTCEKEKCTCGCSESSCTCDEKCTCGCQESNKECVCNKKENEK